MNPIYLDHNATTPVAPRVLDVMLPFLRTQYGNPSSNYEPGRKAREAIETARAEVAALIGASPGEIVFTSGGTESSNIAIRSGAHRTAEKLPVVTSTIEHPATEEPCKLLERQGFAVKRIKPKSSGIVDVGEFAEAIGDKCGLVTLIHAQNEIGTLQPVAEIAAIAHARDALVHADAAQSAGKVAVDVRAMGVDLLSIAGHKLYAPKGIGALYIRRGVKIPPLLLGAGQESGRRPGTENVPYIVGLGEACRLASIRMQEGMSEVEELTDELLERLQDQIPGLKLVGHPDQRLPNTLNVLFPRANGRKLLQACPRVFASTGSACHADREDPSAVLLELGIPAGEALGAIRLSLGATTTRQDVDEAAAALAAAWRMVADRKKAGAPA